LEFSAYAALSVASVASSSSEFALPSTTILRCPPRNTIRNKCNESEITPAHSPPINRVFCFAKAGAETNLTREIFMSMNALCGAGLGAAMMLLVQANPAAALSTTFMSGTGNDAYPCTRAAPCRTVVGAYAKTDAGGEIFALEAGAYGGNLQILKSITITGVDGASVTDIYINAAATDIVVLTRLHFETSINSPLRVVGGGKVLVDNCLMDSNGGRALSIDPSSTNVTAIVSNCRITNNDVGVWVTPAAGKAANVVLNNVQIDHSASQGIYVAGAGAGRVTLNNCTTVFNPNLAIYVSAPGKVYTLGNNLISGSILGALTPIALQ